MYPSTLMMGIKGKFKTILWQFKFSAVTNMMNSSKAKTSLRTYLESSSSSWSPKLGLTCSLRTWRKCSKLWISPEDLLLSKILIRFSAQCKPNTTLYRDCHIRIKCLGIGGLWLDLETQLLLMVQMISRAVFRCLWLPTQDVKFRE